jgi:hypothetical protein
MQFTIQSIINTKPWPEPGPKDFFFRPKPSKASIAEDFSFSLSGRTLCRLVTRPNKASVRQVVSDDAMTVEVPAFQLISDENEHLHYPTMCLARRTYYISLVDLWTVTSVKVLNSRRLHSGLVAAAVVF